MSFQNANVLLQSFAERYGNLDRKYWTIDFVRDVSRANTSVELTPDSFLNAPGKLRSVRLNYVPLLCDTEGDCNTQTLCSTGERVQPVQVMFDLDQCIATKVYSVAKNDIRLTDNGNWDFSGFALEIFAKMILDARGLMARRWETQLYTMAGVHPDGNYEKRATLVDPTTGIINPMGRVNIDREYLDSGFSMPYILGGAEVYNWQQMTSIGGLNASGQLINRVDTNRSYYDNGLGDSILGGTGGHILTIAPEMFKYVYYLENAGIFRTDMARPEDLGRIYKMGMDGFIEGTLIDPVTGIPWDFFVNYDKCTQTWSFWMKHTYGFFIMPDVACNGVDVNGIMRWSTCPPVVADCPTGTTPSPVVAQRVWSWTPGSIFPLAASSSLIGGVANQQNTPVAITNLTELAAFMNDAYGVQDLFSVSGSVIRYTGWSELDGNINGNVTINFA